MLKCLHGVDSLITFLCILSLLQLFPILITQKTRVCSSLPAARIAEKKPHTHTLQVVGCVSKAKREKLNYECRSASNIGSHDTFPSVSQQEAVISLAPDCMCVATADTFLMKNSILLGVYADVCKSGGQLCFLAITRNQWGVESIFFSSAGYEIFTHSCHTQTRAWDVKCDLLTCRVPNQRTQCGGNGTCSDWLMGWSLYIYCSLLK